MKSYRVSCYEVCVVTRTVEAKSEDEAKQLAESGHGEFIDCVQMGQPDVTKTTVYPSESSELKKK